MPKALGQARRYRWIGVVAATLMMTVVTTGEALAATSRVVPSPNQTPNDNTLMGVDGVARNNVWAAGYALNDARGNPRSMLQRWDGATWSLVDHPRRSGLNVLLDVDVIAASDVWAVGRRNAFPGDPGRTVTLHRDGAAWSIVPSPNAAGSNGLNAVEAAASDDVWAVGSHTPRDSASQPLVMR